MVTVDAGWDAWLSRFSDASIKQTSAWARLKEGAWRPAAVAAMNGNAPLALALGLSRRAPLGAATVLWFNGGPVYRQPNRPEAMNLASLGKVLAEIKKAAEGLPRPVVRVNAYETSTVEAQLVMRQAGFLRPLVPLSTGLTYVVDLTKSLDELRENLERNWRNQLKQAEKSAPKFELGTDDALLARYAPLHEELRRRKKLKGQALTLSDLKRMRDILGALITFFMVSLDGKDACGGALWIHGKRGYFALSAANAVGLEHYLPNFMYWKAIEHLKAAGCEEFDLTGIDPRANWGVFNFKRGLNARPVEQLGEWEWSPSDWTRRAFNLALWLNRERLA